MYVASKYLPLVSLQVCEDIAVVSNSRVNQKKVGLAFVGLYCIRAVKGGVSL